MEAGKLIKDLRLKKGMTQEELADRTEVSVRTIQRIENGEVDPRAYTLQMIAKALEVDYGIFVEKDTSGNEEVQNTNITSWNSLLHLSGILPLIVPTFLIWKHKSEKTEEMATHYRASISLQLCVLGVSIGGLWVYYKTGITTPLIGSLILGALMSIMNSIYIMHGKTFYNPFNKQSKSDNT